MFNFQKPILFFLMLVLLSGHRAEGQAEEIRRRLKTLNFTDQLPKDILSSKTVVLVDIPPSGLYPKIRGEWHTLAETVQPGFHKAGIDAVTYYHFDEIASGPEPYKAYLNHFDKRNLSHGAFISKKGRQYQLLLLKFADRKYLISEGQDAFMMNGDNPEVMMDMLSKKTVSSGLVMSNLLIMETPEYSEPVTVITGKRSEFYDLNFESEKLAVPVFASKDKITRALKQYPYQWDFVPYDMSQDEIRKSGYQYVLYYVNTTVKNAREMLGYDTKESPTAFVSAVKKDGKLAVVNQNANAQVFKFYIRHIKSKNTFVGKRWDPGYTWQEGLGNYISNLRDQLLKN